MRKKDKLIKRLINTLISMLNGHAYAVKSWLYYN
jgi:hypothetical protein